MPLIKSSSDKARQKNIEKEIASGKEPKVAVAIGYSVQREAKKDKKESKKDAKTYPMPPSRFQKRD
jgi:hypothetical protein